MNGTEETAHQWEKPIQKSQQTWDELKKLQIKKLPADHFNDNCNSRSGKNLRAVT